MQEALIILLLTPTHSFLLPEFLFSAIQKYVPWTAAHTVFAWEAPVGVRKAGPAQRAIRELATRGVPSTGPARTASVNAAKDGTGSTAPLVGPPDF